MSEYIGDTAKRHYEKADRLLRGGYYEESKAHSLAAIAVVLTNAHHFGVNATNEAKMKLSQILA